MSHHLLLLEHPPPARGAATRNRKQTIADSCFLYLLFASCQHAFSWRRRLERAPAPLVRFRTDALPPAAPSCRRARRSCSVLAAGCRRAAGARRARRAARRHAAQRPAGHASTPCAPIGSAATAYAGAATPTLDALAARGVRFATAIAHVPLTGPSHASHPHRPHPARATASATTAATSLPARGDDGGRGLPAGGLPHGGLRLGLSARPPLRLRSRLRDLRRPPAAGQRPAPHALRRALRRCHHGRRAALAVDAPPAAPARRPSSCGSTTTIPTRPTSRPGELAERFRAAPYDGEIAFVDAQLARLLRALEEKGPLGADARPRHRRSRREPGRARRGHPRPLRLRRHAAGAVDHGRAGRGRRPRARRPSPAASTCCRRCSTTPGCPAARHRGPLAAAGRGGTRDERRARLRGVALRRARVRLGAAARLADRALQADRGAAPGALRPGRGRRRRRTNRAGASRPRRPTELRRKLAGGAVAARRRPAAAGVDRGDRGAAGRARLSRRRRAAPGARRRRPARSQGRRRA